ncbi:MAG: methyl-accepting chemotaxis protein [Acidimicrobiales bacterium]
MAGPLSRMRSLSVRGKLLGLGAGAIVGLLLFAALSIFAMSAVRIGAERYAVISENNVLLADVLPPPAYLVEADLVAHQMLVAAQRGDDATVSALTERMGQLRADYDARQEYWAANTILDRTTLDLVQASAEPGHRFLDLVDEQYVPTLERGDVEAASALLTGELNDAYESHRAAVDAIVARTGDNALATEADARSLSSLLLKAVIAGLVVTLLGVLLLVRLVSRSVTAPLDELRSRLADIAAGGGDLRTRLAEDRGDELGEIARLFNRFVGSLAATVAHVREQAVTLREEATVLERTSEQLSEASRRTEAQTHALARSSNEVSDTMSSVQTAASEIQQAVGEISRSATSAAMIASGGVDAAERADSMMRSLSTASEEIQAVMSAIVSIAEQTNLLALNATIEAARAGEAGKGFAVVAAEVKDLAQATAEATTGIGPRLDAIGAATGAAAAALADVRQVITDIANSQSVIASAVEEQTATTRQIEQHVSGAADSTRTIAESVEQTLATTSDTVRDANETSASATRVSEAAADLLAVMSQFSV